MMNRRAFLSLAAIRRATGDDERALLPKRVQDMVVYVLDDDKDNALMATIAVWGVKGYSWRAIVERLAKDFGICEKRA